MESASRKAIQDRTTGIIFLGTPHSGSQLARPFAKLSIFIDAPESLLSVLSTRSEALFNITFGFTKHCHGLSKVSERWSYVPFSHALHPLKNIRHRKCCDLAGAGATEWWWEHESRHSEQVTTELWSIWYRLSTVVTATTDSTKQRREALLYNLPS